MESIMELKLYEDKEISVVLQALGDYMYKRSNTTEEQFEIANRIMDRIDENL